MATFIALHTATAIIAILAGLAVVIFPKGTIRHRRIGWTYVGSMLLMCGLSFFIRDINGGSFSLFHAISIQATLFVAAGLAASVLRDRLRNWVVWHLRFMLYSYVTLIVTGIAQAYEYLPFGRDALNAIIFIQVPVFIGWWLIEFRGAPKWSRQFSTEVAQASGMSR